MSNVSQLQAANNKEIVFKNKFRCSPSAALWFRCLCLLVLIKTPICIFNLTTSLSFLRVCSLRNWIWFSIHWAEFNYVYGSTAGGISASSKLIFQHFSNTSPPASAITYHQRISGTENPENGQVQKIRTRRLFSSNRTRASLPLNWTESGKLNASRNFLRLCALICRCYNKGHKKVGGFFFCGGGFLWTSGTPAACCICWDVALGTWAHVTPLRWGPFIFSEQWATFPFEKRWNLRPNRTETRPNSPVLPSVFFLRLRPIFSSRSAFVRSLLSYGYS